MAVLVDHDGTRDAGPGCTVEFTHGLEELRGVVERLVERRSWETGWPEGLSLAYLVAVPWIGAPNVRRILVYDTGESPRILVLAPLGRW
jgi:hypothetical protein